MTWWHYLLLTNLYLVLFYGFYMLFLRRETFFQLNRVYLVGAAILSFLIPIIQSDWVKHLFITQKVQETIYSIGPMVAYQFSPAEDHHITIGQIVVWVYAVGIIVLTFRLVWQLMVLRYTINHPEPTEAYSFFNEVQLGENIENREVVAAHEYVHMRQWHSADILLIEFIMIINWFNPVVYLYRMAIKHIHEFIADHNAIEAGTNKAEYALMLLSQTFTTPTHQLVTPFFNHSLLKQRIIMLQKGPSRRSALVKYGLSAPLFALMLVLSSATINESKVVTIIRDKAEQVFSEEATENHEYVIPPPPADDADVYIDETKGLTATVEKTKASISRNHLSSGEKSLNVEQQRENTIFMAVEKVPEFPGGMQAFSQFLARNIRYPSEMRAKGIQGRVIVQFVVEEDGTLTNIKSLRDVGYGSAEEAVRVIGISPKWNPGVQNGKKVRVLYTVPIAFALEDSRMTFTDTLILREKVAHNEPVKMVRFNYVTEHLNTDSNKAPTRIFIKSTNTPDAQQPIVMIDGKVFTTTYLAKLNPNNIQSISVLKDQTAQTVYGQKAKNGILIVTTKKKVQE